MDSFQRFAPQARFEPRAVADVASALEAESNRRLSDLQRQQGQQEQRAQNLIQDSQLPNYTMEALSQFSKTASKFVEDYAKRTAKDIDVGAQFDSIYNPTLSPAEQQIIDGATVQQATAGQAANQLEAAGDVIGAENLRQDLNRVGQGVADERAKLIEARSAYPSEIQQIINSNDKLAELYNQNPMSALEIATKMFIENRGLQYTTKRNFVDVLGQTIRQTNSYMAQGQVNARIKEEKDVRKAELLNSAVYNGSIATPATAPFDFQMMSDQLLNDNNGILTRGGANQAAARAMLQGAATVSEDQINIIAGIPVNPNQPNTTIGSTYAQDVQKARLDYQTLKGKQDRARRDQITTALIESIQDPNMDPIDRAQLTEQAAQELEAAGDYVGAFDLRSKAGTYAADPEATANFVNLQQQVAEGAVVPTDQQLSEMVADGRLTSTGANSIRTQRERRFKEVRDTSKGVASSNIARVTSQLKITVGAEFDPTTGNFNISSDDAALSKGTVKAVYTDYKSQLQLDLKEYALTLDPNDTVANNEAKLQQRANEFYERETQTPSGRFWMGGLFTMDGKQNAGTPEYEQIKNAGRVYGSQGTQPQRQGVTDWSADWNPGQGVNNRIQSEYKRGDVLYTQEEVEAIQASITNPGTGIPTSVIQAARDLSMTPMEFLNSQLNYYGYPSISPDLESFKNAKQAVVDKPEFISIDAKNAMFALIGQGLSTEAAAIGAAVNVVLSRQERVGGVLGIGTQGDSKFDDENWLETTLGGLTPEEQALIQNPNATTRTLTQLIPSNVDKNEVIAISKKLLQLVGY